MSLFPQNNKKTRWQKNSGFTLLELLVVISITVIVSTVVLSQFPLFSSKIVLENVAHKIALSIRQAQYFGINVRTFGTGEEGEFPPYGVHFYLGEGAPTSGSDQADRKNFILFADVDPPGNPDKKFDRQNCATEGYECVERFTIQSSDQILMMCGNAKLAGIPAGDILNWEAYEGAECSVTMLDIVFSRPNPEASIIGYNPDASGSKSKTYSDAEIVVQSNRGDIKTIVVWQTGQISVE